MGRRVLSLTVVFLAVFLAVGLRAWATIFTTVKGGVVDPQLHPVAGATVTIKADQSDWQQTATTAQDGTFEIARVPIGEYAATIVAQGFTTVSRHITATSDAPLILRVQLQLRQVSEAVTVTAKALVAESASTTPTTLVSRQDIQNTPGADRTNSLGAITAFVPGSYVTHDQLHIRGGHQVSWLVDGVPVPNTNIASNVGPQFDPKDIDVLEVQRGSYDAQYGDRTYGVFNVVPRTGFERNSDAEVVLSGGDYRQTNDQASVGGHSARLAYFVSGNGNRSDLGLGTPTARVIHDHQQGGGAFGSLVFNPNASNQLRVVTSVRHDVYQIPNTAEDQAAGVDDAERESDAFVNVSWVRTFRSGVVLTVSPFYHYNTANYAGGPSDPIVTFDERRSHYAGAQATVSGEATKHNWEVGVYGFRQWDTQLFALTFNDGSQANLSQHEQPVGTSIAVFAQDTLAVNSWLTLTGGVRQTHFASGLVEDATSPRVGATIRLPKVDWAVRGFYGRFYQGPPLMTVSGPLLAFVTAQNLGVIPLRGERDHEYQVGVTVPVRGWTVDGDHFRTIATNFFDHNPIGNSNIFLPVTIDGALVEGTEVTVRSPPAWTAGSVHLAYSYQTAQGRGSISGGLTDLSSGGGYFPLDHDQRQTLSVGGDARLPGGATAAVNVYFGSGFLDGDNAPAHLPGHATVDVSVRKTFGQRVSASIAVLNLANTHVLIDNSLTFGGVHFNNPREVYGELRYRFHY